MRGMAFGATLVAAACVAAAPAAAHETVYRATVHATGALTATWHGDRGRGCAAAGLCPYRGSVSARVGFSSGDLELVTEDGRPTDAFGYANLDEPSVVRVLRGDEAACVDLGTGGELIVSLRPSGHGGIRLSLGLPSAFGRGLCAGPDLSPLLTRLVSRRLLLARMRRGSTTVGLPLNTRYASGRFSGALRSTLRVRLGRLRSRRSERNSIQVSLGTAKAGVRRPRLVRVNATYRVTGLSGKLTTDSRAPGTGSCADLDACGARGSSSWAILSAGGTLQVTAAAPARRGDRGLRGALAALGRGRGQLQSYGTVRHGLGTTSTLMSWPGGRTCTDSLRVAAPGFAFSVDRGRIPISLGGEETFPAAGDFARAGCPGPPSEDVLGLTSIADGSLPPGALRAERLVVPLRAAGRFHDRGYSGTRRARFTLGLRRESLRVAYTRARP